MQNLIIAVGLQSERHSELKLRWNSRWTQPLALAGVRHDTLSYVIWGAIGHAESHATGVTAKHEFVNRLRHEYDDVGHLPDLVLERLVSQYTLTTIEPDGVNMTGGLLRIRHASSKEVLFEDHVTRVTNLIFDLPR